MHDLLAMILAGGEGSRLRPLTNERAKPAVPFGGRYRLVDFVLSNFVNSGVFRIKVLTQYKSESLNQHIMRGWRLASMVDQYIEIVPAQQRTGKNWFQGSADAIYQNLNLLSDESPRDVAVFGADNIYKMDIRQMIDAHRSLDAALTVAAIPVPIEEASAFGMIHANEAGEIIGFVEKPENPPSMPGDPTRALASMGNYIFKTESLIEQVRRDASIEESAHDFGKSIITHMVNHSSERVCVYDFSLNTIPGQPDSERGYWRDVGTIRSYWQTSMDLVSITPQFDLYNRHWPIRTVYAHHPPAKFVHDDQVNLRVGTAVDSIVAEGVIVSGGAIRNSVLFPNVRVHSYSHVDESVLFDRVQVGRHAKLRRVIVDKGVEIPPGEEIGFDHEEDRKRFTVSDGIVVIPKGMVFDTP
jgi:glucose-1-phosphate adenylyltransferase